MIKVDRIKYDEDVKVWALRSINRLRPVVFLGPKHLGGRCFSDTEHVFIILESMFKQSDFEQYPLLAIESALKEAASVDYWYEHEKDYGSKEVEDVSECPCCEDDGSDY